MQLRYDVTLGRYQSFQNYVFDIYPNLFRIVPFSGFFSDRSYQDYCKNHDKKNFRKFIRQIFYDKKTILICQAQAKEYTLFELSAPAFLLACVPVFKIGLRSLMSSTSNTLDSLSLVPKHIFPVGL